MFMWGTGSSDLYSQLEGANDPIWHETQGATHKVVFRGGEHWDYLRQGTTVCANFNGPCTLMRDVAVVEQQEPVAAGVRFAMQRGRRLVRRARACGAVG